MSTIDGRGQERFPCLRLKKDGIERRCGQCVPTSRRYELNLLPAKEERAAWRPLRRAAVASMREKTPA